MAKLRALVSAFRSSLSGSKVLIISVGFFLSFLLKLWLFYMLFLPKCKYEKVLASSAQAQVCSMQSDCIACVHTVIRVWAHVRNRDFYNHSPLGRVLSHIVFSLETARNSSFQNSSGKFAAASEARVKCHPFLSVFFYFPSLPCVLLSSCLSFCLHRISL